VIPAAIHGDLRNFERTLHAGGEAMRLSTAFGFPQYHVMGGIHVAWARAQIGEISGIAEQIQESLAQLDAQGFVVVRPQYLTILCEAQAVVGAVEDALITVEQALLAGPEVLVRRAHTLRLRGELRLRKDPGDQAGVEFARQDFREAIELARSMDAKSYELSATTALARMLAQQGRRDEARAMLAEIYGWFTEGFDTRDLKEAKALLDELSAP
jgi:predicted ATPase